MIHFECSSLVFQINCHIETLFPALDYQPEYIDHNCRLNCRHSMKSVKVEFTLANQFISIRFFFTLRFTCFYAKCKHRDIFRTFLQPNINPPWNIMVSVPFQIHIAWLWKKTNTMGKKTETVYEFMCMHMSFNAHKIKTDHILFD